MSFRVAVIRGENKFKKFSETFNWQEFRSAEENLGFHYQYHIPTFQ